MTRAGTRRALSRLIAVGLAVAAIAVGPGEADRPTAEAAPASQRVLLISDSVGLGTRGVLDDVFPPDWDVTIIGKPAAFVESLVDAHFRPLLAVAPWLVGDHVVVAGGYNYPYWDPERFDRSIDQMVNALTSAGVKHVHWVTLREVKPQYVSASAWRGVQPYYWYFPTVNEHLREALWRHPSLSLVDWAANADRPGITYDAIHLNRTGAELYSTLIRRSVDRAATRLADRSVVEVDVTDDPDAVATIANLTAVVPRTTGYATAYPCDESRPEVSQLVYRRDSVVASGAVVPVDDDGRLCVFNLSGTNFVVDVSAVVTDAAGLLDRPPNRVFDSRSDPGHPLSPGTHEIVVTDGDAPVTDPSALTVTALFPDRSGYVSIHPCDDDGGDTGVDGSATVTINLAAPGRNVPNTTLIEPDDDGRICATVAHATIHLLVDRTATFTSPDALTVTEPHRVVDTRDLPSRPRPDDVVRISLDDTLLAASGDVAAEPGDPVEPAPNVRALGLNLGVIRPDGPGFATAWPCDEPRPETSNLNFFRGDVVSNFVVGPLDADGEVCVSATVGTHLTVDVLAGLADGFDAGTPSRAFDSRTS